MHEEDKDFPRPQRLVTLADFFPTKFLCDHQDESSKVVACHAINLMEEESTSLRSLKDEGVSKALSRVFKRLEGWYIEVLKESFTTLFTKITKQEIKIDLTEASLPQRRTKDGFDPKAYKLMVKAGYDFTAHTEFKSLKIHEQPELSLT
ncbi:gypsy-like retrotransposase [Cucumis melo var. makuwa]|uniref:Gypsy-like retrotransposase n=1 Tax=Cucumis melo var. makuwa TaxID=1194695 RepID=A0A5D3BZH0_CUCMM|nr:gypsy-like retrotransposase [Cucumis melo var. makuwa]TYK04408.1 gypsy-like retrotransposase [Cucumis melo var. makuwa]